MKYLTRAITIFVMGMYLTLTMGCADLEGATVPYPTLDNGDEYYDIGACGMPEYFDRLLMDENELPVSPRPFNMQNGDNFLAKDFKKGLREYTMWYYDEDPEFTPSIYNIQLVKSQCEDLRIVGSWWLWRQAMGLPKTTSVSTIVKDICTFRNTPEDECDMPDLELEMSMKRSINTVAKLYADVDKYASKHPELVE